jgi:serine O-acetyltransferase
MDLEKLNRLATVFKDSLDPRAAESASCACRIPSRPVVEKVCHDYVQALFALFHYSSNGSPHFVEEKARFYLQEVRKVLFEQICHAVCVQAVTRGDQWEIGFETEVRDKIETVFEEVPGVARLLASDVDAAFSNDPAAGGYEEVLLAYPCIEAITVQRLAHRLYRLQVPIIPRMMTETAHSHTGIDIHPGASIGESFFIDHGTGVVIGETATIGNKVTLYHGVTLGAFNPLVKDEHAQLRRGSQNKRHPDLEDHVTVYPNATILGGNTRIGHHSTIGGNVWLTHSVVPYSKVLLKEPGLYVRPKNIEGSFIGENI